METKQGFSDFQIITNVLVLSALIEYLCYDLLLAYDRN